MIYLPALINSFSVICLSFHAFWIISGAVVMGTTGLEADKPISSPLNQPLSGNLKTNSVLSLFGGHYKNCR